MRKEIKTVTIVGMGALGLLFGGCIQRGIGQESMSFLMDEDRKKKYSDQIFYENGKEVKFQLLSDREFRENEKTADLVIVSVKYLSLPSAVELLKQSRCVGDDTILISFMNGIDSEEILADAFGANKIVYSVAQGMDAMKFGNKLNYTKMGAVHIGSPKGADQTNADCLDRFFASIDFPYVREEDILYRMWAKFMLNVGVNQTCMAYGTTYGGVLAAGEPHDTFLAAMEETVKIANAEGIALSRKDIDTYIRIIGTLSPEGTPSMGQDRINHNPSEVDMFSGKIMQLGQKHGIPVPANEMLYHMAKEIEKDYV